MREIITRVALAARIEMSRQDPAHDWHHIERVRKMALAIARAEGADEEIVELAALVHDVGDRKVHSSEEAGDQAVRYLLMSCGVESPHFEAVVDIARRVSFKGLGVPDDMPKLEGRVVQDADRLDAIGAIAIARTFTWGGAKGRPIHDPSTPIFVANNPEEYYGSGGKTSINHFHEKLLHLKDRMHTQTAKQIAEERHEFMVAFLKQFDQEWEGSA
jgi:uncharacterized protein